jgi:DinB superfamily
MKTDLTTLSFTDVLAQAEAISNKAQVIFGRLTVEQINWKPNVESWSVGQCFDHLIITNRGYFPQLDQIIRGERRKTLWQSLPLLSGFWGRLLINMLNPNSTKRVNAPKLLQPTSSNIDPQIIGRFAAHQNEVIDKMKATERMDLDKIIVSSPSLKIMTFSLYDVFRIIVVHETRHFKQAQRVMDTPAFPK